MKRKRTVGGRRVERKGKGRRGERKGGTKK